MGQVGTRIDPTVSVSEWDGQRVRQQFPCDVYRPDLP